MSFIVIEVIWLSCQGEKKTHTGKSFLLTFVLNAMSAKIFVSLGMRWDFSVRNLLSFTEEVCMTLQNGGNSRTSSVCILEWTETVFVHCAHHCFLLVVGKSRAEGQARDLPAYLGDVSSAVCGLLWKNVTKNLFTGSLGHDSPLGV